MFMHSATLASAEVRGELKEINSTEEIGIGMIRTHEIQKKSVKIKINMRCVMDRKIIQTAKEIAIRVIREAGLISKEKFDNFVELRSTDSSVRLAASRSLQLIA